MVVASYKVDLAMAIFNQVLNTMLPTLANLYGLSMNVWSRKESIDIGEASLPRQTFYNLGGPPGLAVVSFCPPFTRNGNITSLMHVRLYPKNGDRIPVEEVREVYQLFSLDWIESSPRPGYTGHDLDAKLMS
ncbi:MAG: hypothetical protein ABIJ34_07270 [archaeon]